MPQTLPTRRPRRSAPTGSSSRGARRARPRRLGAISCMMRLDGKEIRRADAAAPPTIAPPAGSADGRSRSSSSRIRSGCAAPGADAGLVDATDPEASLVDLSRAPRRSAGIGDPAGVPSADGRADLPPRPLDPYFSRAAGGRCAGTSSISGSSPRTSGAPPDHRSGTLPYGEDEPVALGTTSCCS